MLKKKAFILRMKPEVSEALEKWAADEFRSVNGQIEYLLHEALKKNGRLKQPISEEKNNPISNSG